MKNKQYGNLGELWKRTRPQSRKSVCYTVGCSSKCARNHLLKQKGIITQITEHKHVRELRTDRFKPPKHYYSLKRVGWEKAMTVYSYCSKCDHQLFSNIEVPMPSIPRNTADFCRYSLRPVAHEIRKKEGNLKFISARDGKAKGFINRRGEYQLTKLKATESGILWLKALLQELTKGLTEEIPISFTVRRLPRIEVCASSILIPPVALYVKKEDLSAAEGSFDGTSFSIVNLFPFEDKSVLIVGTHQLASEESRNFQKHIESADINELTQLVSNMLVAQIEDWAISENLYKSLPSNFESIVTKAKVNQFSDFDKDFGINLFSLQT